MSQAAATPVAAPAKREPPRRKALLKDFHQTGHLFFDREYMVPEDVSVQDLLEPEYWASVAHLLKVDVQSGRQDGRGTIIRCVAFDFSWEVELFVRVVQEHGLLVAVRKPNADGVIKYGLQAVSDKTESYKTQWELKHRGWNIIRESDGQIVAEAKNIQSKEAAQEWIDNATKAA